MESKKIHDEKEEKLIQQIIEQIPRANLQKDITNRILAELETASSPKITKREKVFIVIAGCVSTILLFVLIVEIMRYKDVSESSATGLWSIMACMLGVLFLVTIFFAKKLRRIQRKNV
jgi:hypothetical protein